MRYREIVGSLVFIVDLTHESSGRRKDFIYENEDCLLRCQLDTLSNNVYELTITLALHQLIERVRV